MQGKFNWPEQWVAVEDPDNALLTELDREMGEGHGLQGRVIRAIGRRKDCDDVLFSLNDGQLALVHLIFSGKREKSPDFPWTTVYASFDEFIQDSNSS